VDIDIYI